MMSYSILNKLKSEGKLGSCSVIVSHEGSLRRHITVFGRDITRLSRPSIEFRGGETGNERLTVPIESVLEIKLGSRTVFRRKKRIERIYPRA